MPTKFTLPNAIKTPSGIWTKVVEIASMTGREEDILQDQRMAPGGKGRMLRSPSERMTEILSRCTVSVGGDESCPTPEARPEGKDRKSAPLYFQNMWKNAFMNDRGYVVIRLRQYSLGDEFIYETNCPHCKKELKQVRVELDRLEVSDRPIEMVTQDEFSVKLPDSGDRAVWRMLTGKDEEILREIQESRKADRGTAFLRLHLLTVGGVRVTDEVVRDLSSRDRRALTDEFQRTEGGIDTRIELTCDSCGFEFSQMLNVGHPNFFFPSVHRSGSSMTSDTSQKPTDGDRT